MPSVAARRARFNKESREERRRSRCRVFVYVNKPRGTPTSTDDSQFPTKRNHGHLWACRLNSFPQTI
jgi:hypothetical protein